jgi:phospholipid/cholesterol/gamma-HCH transport system substrate-binding protein
MPRTRSLAWSELKIGLMSVFAIIVATAFIFLLTGSNGFFWQRYSLKAVFPDIAGLKEGAPVRLAGVEVGSVTGVQFAGDRVEVEMEVLKENRPRITTMSVATLGSVSLLGEAALDITASSAGAPIPDWGYVRSKPAGSSLASMADSANAGLEEATALMQDIRGGGEQHEPGSRHHRPVDERSGRRPFARGLARQPADPDRPDPQRRGESRQAAE